MDPHDHYKPLNQEQIDWLVAAFAKAKARVEAIWGPSGKPWHR